MIINTLSILQKVDQLNLNLVGFTYVVPLVLCDISNTRDSGLSPFVQPTRELRIKRHACAVFIVLVSALCSYKSLEKTASIFNNFRNQQGSMGKYSD